ncbi:MAG: glycosyltransferase [Solidesulfovibrio sp.]
MLSGRPGTARRPQVVIENFIEDMAEAYAWADLVLARAGATTLAEVTAAGKAVAAHSLSVRHPRPPVRQRRVSGATGAAEVVAQNDLDQLRSGREPSSDF